MITPSLGDLSVLDELLPTTPTVEQSVRKLIEWADATPEKFTDEQENNNNAS
jgi:hypothetical protein